MNKNIRNLSAIALVSLLGIFTEAGAPASAAEPPAPTDFVGLWHGSLAVGQNRLRLVFDLRLSEEGELEATLDSPDQGAMDIPVATASIEGDSIRLEIRVIGATYTGQLTEETEIIEGEWRQSGQVLPLELERSDETR